ncbi:hypothetical protein ABN763_11130 [Spongiivirga sp. MCCC 1A20706]|uniref:hypothetical protein n=1 Tax=Spongiivirga sp. MCCC 1A20706 TaxID=3160963 RepID=UPI0039778E50
MTQGNGKIILVEAEGVNEVAVGNNKVIVKKMGKSATLKPVNIDPSQKVRWIWIAVEYLEKAKQALSGEHVDEWGEWTQKITDTPIDKFGIGKQYTTSFSVGANFGHEDHYIRSGTIFYFESFYDEPTLDKGIFVGVTDQPKILSAYFASYADEFMYPGESENSKIYTYKSVIRLYVSTHLIPNHTVKGHNFALFEVDIYDADGDKKVTDEPLKFFQTTNPGHFSINSFTELDITIDEKWRDASGHEPKTLKRYYAKIKTTLYHNEDAETGEGAKNIEDNKLLTGNPNYQDGRYLKFTNRFRGVAPNGEAVGITFKTEDEVIHWFWGRQLSKGKRKAASYQKTTLDDYNLLEGEVLEGQTTYFDVRYDKMDVILENFQVSKTNMMAVVGDVEYTRMNGHPCKYSKVVISHEKKNEKREFVLFDENATTKKVTDNTDMVFGIVAGDKKEKVSIVAEGLEIQDVNSGEKPRCDGITMRKVIRKGKIEAKRKRHKGDTEFVHKSIQDVFDLENVHILFPERINNKNATAQESSGNETVDISSQRIEHSYTDKGVDLKLGYLYNKTYDSRAEKWLGDRFGNWTNDLLDIAWIVRYFVLKKEYGQTYFVPISTCRYPNQTAVIEVFPDVEWWINFKFNSKNALYVRQQPNYKYRIFHPNPTYNQKKAGEYGYEKSQSGKVDFEVEFEAGFKYNGKEIKFNSGEGFPLVNAINFFLMAYKVFKKISFADECEEAEGPVANGTAQSSRGAAAKKMTQRYQQRKGKGFPFRIEVSQPSFSGGVHGFYQQSKKTEGAYGAMYEAKFAADPLFSIKGKLDLLFFAQFIGPIGQALDKIGKVVKRIDYLTFGAVKIDYFLYLAAKVDLKIEVSGVNHHSIDGWGGGELNATMPIKVWLEAGVDVDVKLQGVGSLDADAIIRGEANMDLNLFLDKRNSKMPMEFQFKGLDVKIWLNFKAESKRKEETKKKGNDQSDPVKKPSAVRKLLGPGKRWKVEIL